MNYLLDVSTLVALLVESHVDNDRVTRWITGKKLAVCPLTELGFMRVAQAAYNSTTEQARQALKDFTEAKQPGFVAADISALAGVPAPSYRKSTDWYLANLAEKHGMKWATLDKEANHPAAVLV